MLCPIDTMLLPGVRHNAIILSCEHNAGSHESVDASTTKHGATDWSTPSRCLASILLGLETTPRAILSSTLLPRGVRHYSFFPARRCVKNPLMLYLREHADNTSWSTPLLFFASTLLRQELTDAQFAWAHECFLIEDAIAFSRKCAIVMRSVLCCYSIFVSTLILPPGGRRSCFFSAPCFIRMLLILCSQEHCFYCFLLENAITLSRKQPAASGTGVC